MNHIVMAFATLGAAVQAGGATYSATSFGTSLLTHALLMRRYAFCVMDRLFGWTRKLEGTPGFGRMSAAVADEVQVISMLAPLLGTDLRARSCSPQTRVADRTREVAFAALQFPPRSREICGVFASKEEVRRVWTIAQLRC